MKVVDDRLKSVGELERVESDRILTSYTFDLTNHVLSSQFIDNPNRDKLYTFIAYRVKDSDSSPVSLIQQHKTKGVN